MKKWMLIMAALVVLFAASCEFPDYQLNWTIDVVSRDANSITVVYTLTNTGSKDLRNATIQVEVDPSDAEPLSSWTSPINLGEYDSESGSITFIFSSTLDNAPAVYVLGAGWDDSDDNDDDGF